MDDIEQLNSLLAPILNDPEAMAGIANAAAQLGLGGITEKSGNSAEPPPEQEKASPEPENGALSGDMLSVMSRLVPLLGEMNREDDTTRLLCALKPFMRGERAKRLEDAERIVKLLRIASSLRGQGIL